MKASLALAAYLLAIAFSTATAHAARYSPHRAGDYPPHHALWLCIHSHEARSWSATNGIYRGGLQLHLGWGYGSSYDAAADSQVTQEWAAERAYRASGYSTAWLTGQWFRWNGGYGCLAMA